MFTNETALFRKAIPSLGNSKILVKKLSGVSASLDNTFRQKFVRVCVLGANSPVGEATAFLLKQNPIVSQIYLYGENADVKGIAADLRHLDTRSEIKGYWGKEELPKAIRRADIVLLIGQDKDPLNADAETKLKYEARRVVEFAQACSKFAPKSIIAVCINPISSTLPLVEAIFRRTHWYNPARLIGSVGLVQVRANSYAARYQDLDPVSVQVPLIGGPDIENVVALFSRATPVNLMPPDCCILQERIQNSEIESPIKTVKKPCKLITSPLSEAYGINHMVTTMGIGLCGDDKAICNAFVRQTILRGSRHLVSTVKFGPGGVVHNYGIPRLTRFELRSLEKSLLNLHKREKMALDILAQIEKQKDSKRHLASMVQISPHAPKSSKRKD